MDQNELIRRLSGEYPYRVLMIDDDPLQRLLIEEILEPPQYHLTYAPGGQDGLDWLCRAEFDVVLTDRRMPGMDGDEFCRRVRSDLGLAVQPILMITGLSLIHI